jgi:hypothetical protein
MSEPTRRLTVAYVTHVFGVWFILTVIIGLLSLGHILLRHQFDLWNAIIFDGFRFIIVPGLFALTGFYVARESDHTVVAATGTLVIVVATLSLSEGNPGIGCNIPAEYERWRNIKIRFATEGFTNPIDTRLLVSTDPTNCAFDGTGTYTIQLGPLIIGYGLLAAVLPQKSSLFGSD